MRWLKTCRWGDRETGTNAKQHLMALKTTDSCSKYVSLIRIREYKVMQSYLVGFLGGIIHAECFKK